jgi:tRNA (guanine37-N1)-methyltransferase
MTSNRLGSIFISMITFHIITLFPEMFSYLNESMLKRAQENKIISIKIYDLREYGEGKHRVTDEKAYGGGPGMVLKAEPILRAVKKAIGRKKKVKVIVFSPSGKQFSNTHAKRLSLNHKNVLLISGHYEGIDERVVKALKAEKVSIGSYVLTGGELPAMVVVDAVARQIKGVLGKESSLEETRIASPEVYTRPEKIVYKGRTYKVPKVLLSGNHKEIEIWRKNKQK